MGYYKAMAEEQKEEVILSTADGVDGKADKKKSTRPRKDEKPIEELFDLTKPIPKVWVLFCAVARHASLLRKNVAVVVFF